MGCTKNNSQGPAGAIIAPVGNASGDQYIAKLVSYGFPEQDIVQFNDGYLVQGDMMFNKVDLMNLPNNNGLAKPAQERWETGNGLCVKNLDDVADITVFIPTTGQYAVGAGIRIAVQRAMDNYSLWGRTKWGVRFREVTQPTGAKITIQQKPSTSFPSGTWGIAYMTADQFVNTTIDFNDMLNSPPYSTQQVYIKASIETAIHELGHTLNIKHTDRLPSTSTYTHVKGTADSDVYSLFNSSGTINPQQDPVPPIRFSDNDKLMLQYMYPINAATRIDGNSNLITAGNKILLSNVISFQDEGQIMLALQNDYTLKGSFSPNADGSRNWVTVGTNVWKFFTTELGDYIAVTRDRKFYASSNEDTYFTSGTPLLTNITRIDETIGGLIGACTYGNDLYIGYGGSNPIWILAKSNVLNFQLERTPTLYRIGVRGTDAHLYVKDIGTLSDLNSTNWTDVAANVASFQLEGNRIVFVTGDYQLKGSDGISTSPVTLKTGTKAVFCSDNIIAAQSTSNVLSIKEGLNGTWTDNLRSNVKSFRLFNGYFISVMGLDNTFVGKYEINSVWQSYGSANNLFFGQFN